MTVAENLAEFAQRFRLADAPTEIVDQAQLHILDTIGCALAASDSDYAARSFNALQRLGGGGSIAIGQADTLGLDGAIRFNAGVAHMLDFDDTHRTTLNHVSASAAPLALGLAAYIDEASEEMMAAYLVAAEASCRVGLGADGPAFLHRGVHTTSALSVFGCALGAGRLLSLTASQMVHAQGIALSFAGGSMEWQRDGAEAKRLHPGNAAIGGLLAASHAASGVTGPRRPYEGRAGLFHLFLGEDTEVDSGAIVDGLGENWAFADVSIKPYPLVHHVHGVVDCALQLVYEDGIAPDDIDRLTVYLAAKQMPILAEPEETKRNPANEYQGIFSVYHTVATAIARGRMTLDETHEDLLHDSLIADLRDRIDVVADPDSLYPAYYSGRIAARLRGGRIVERAERYHPGCDRRPLPRETVVEKFRANAGQVFKADRVEVVERAVMDMTSEGNAARNFARILSGRTP